MIIQSVSPTLALPYLLILLFYYHNGTITYVYVDHCSHTTVYIHHDKTVDHVNVSSWPSSQMNAEKSTYYAHTVGGDLDQNDIKIRLFSVDEKSEKIRFNEIEENFRKQNMSVSRISNKQGNNNYLKFSFRLH